jgi:phosphoserine phosphatase
MNHVAILVSNALSIEAVEDARDMSAGGPVRWLSPGRAAEFEVEEPEAAITTLTLQFKETDADWALLPGGNRRKKLVLADMDSTIIQCECIDELADFAGVKAEVAAITERAMRGDLDFEAALKHRVALLKGLPLAALQRTFDERVRLTPGAETLVKTMRAGGAMTALISGGFTFFTGRVADLAGFAVNRANRLLDDGARLTGNVAEPILGKAAKLAALHELCTESGIAPEDALCIGDGANDLAMIEAAGLGIAFRAKPVVAEAARARIDHTDLRTALYFQGYADTDFAA